MLAGCKGIMVLQSSSEDRVGKQSVTVTVTTIERQILDCTGEGCAAPARHCSCLSQVEIWFSILARRLLKRASFTALEDLRSRTAKFIAYFNDVLAKPFRWTYTGRPLRA